MSCSPCFTLYRTVFITLIENKSPIKFHEIYNRIPTMKVLLRKPLWKLHKSFVVDGKELRCLEHEMLELCDPTEGICMFGRDVYMLSKDGVKLMKFLLPEIVVWYEVWAFAIGCVQKYKLQVLFWYKMIIYAVSCSLCSVFIHRMHIHYYDYDYDCGKRCL